MSQDIEDTSNLHMVLFPQMAAVVHHAGAGTTAAGLRAGVPTVRVPKIGDQPFWAGRLAALGAAPPPVPHKHLSAAALTAAILPNGSRSATGADPRLEREIRVTSDNASAWVLAQVRRGLYQRV